MRLRYLFALCCSILTVTNTFAANNTTYGVQLSVPVKTVDPTDLHAVLATAWYQPKSLRWEHARVFFDATIGHWWVTSQTPNKSLNIIAVSPVLRYYFYNSSTISPFIYASIGLSYLSKTRIEDRNLGIHFAFQDRLGIGATFGAEQKFTLIASALHYSNGRMASSNAGITAPLMVTAEYGFG